MTVPSGVLFQNPIVKPLSPNATFMSGCTATFYLTGTTTLTPVYADGALTTPLANPLSADASGTFVAVYLDPSIIYRVLIKTSTGQLISDTDPYIPSSVTLLTQSFIGKLFYPKTAAEVAASLTVVDFSYPPGYVDRYGTNATPGTTIMTAAFNAAVKLGKAAGIKVRFGATWPYLLDAPIDCTNAAASTNFMGFAIECEGNIAAATTNAPAYPAILAKHNGHVFDCAGAIGIDFINISVSGDPTTSPQTCWFLARNSAGTGQVMRFLNCRTTGKFGVDVIYNYGSESSVIDGCYFQNSSTAAGTAIVEYTGTNVRGLSSTFITIATGQQSCIDHQIIGGQFVNFNTDVASDVFRTESTDHLKILYPWIRASGRSILYADLSTAKFSSRFRLIGLQGENGGGNTYGIVISNPVALNDLVLGWLVESCYLPNTSGALVALGANATVDAWTLRNLTAPGGSAISIPGLLVGSTFDLTAANALTLGTSKGNVLIGQPPNWTITTRQNDEWVDTRAVKTWAAGTGGLTVVGGLLINRGRSEYLGGRVFVNLVLQAATSIAAGAGVQITGLPSASSDFSAFVQVTDLTTGAVLSGGYVNGANIFLSGWSATAHPVCITAEYFAA